MKTTCTFLLSVTLTAGLNLIAFGQAAQTTPQGTLIANQNSNAAMPASAILEMRSTNKGMLPPRMTTAQISSITSPTKGLMAYDTDLNCLKAYDGTKWDCVGADVVASTPLSSSFAYQSITDNETVSGAISADNSGNTVSVGYFRGAVTFGKSVNSMTLTSMGSADGFIVKHDKDGNLIWATQIGGSVNDQDILDVDVDNSGNIVVSGYLKGATTFYSTNGSSSSFTTSNTYYAQIFVAKYNSSGVLQWFKTAGSSGSYHCEGRGVAFDGNGNVFFTGFYSGVVAFDGQSLTSISTTEDIFIAKLTSSGVYSWVKTAGGTSNTESGFRLVCDNTNNVYLYGWYQGTANFGENATLVTFTSRGGTDGFISKYTSDGTLSWAKTFGSTSDHFLRGGIAYSPSTNSICIAGTYTGTLSFGPGLGSNPLPTVGYTGYYNGYLAKYDLNGNIQWSTRMGNTNGYDSWYGPFHNYTTDLSFDSSGNPYVTGTLRNETYFYSVNTATNYYVKGVKNAEPFLAKYTTNGVLQWVIAAIDGEDDACNSLVVRNNTAYMFGNFKQTLNFGYQQVKSTNNGNYGNLFIWRYAE